MRDNEKVTSLLQLKSDQVRTGAEVLMSKTRDWQVIKQYLCNRLNDFELTYVQEQKLTRYQFIYTNLSSGKYLKHELINMVMKMFKISQRQVYDDLNCTQEIFSSVISVNKLFELQLQLEIAKDMMRKCIEISDMKNAAAIQKNIIAINALFPEEDNAPGQDFEGHTIEAVFDPRLLGSPEITDMKEVLAAINAKRKVHIKTDMFDHLAYEPIPDEKTDSL